jgi:hypothetical protein
MLEHKLLYVSAIACYNDVICYGTTVLEGARAPPLATRAAPLLFARTTDCSTIFAVEHITPLHSISTIRRLVPVQDNYLLVLGTNYKSHTNVLRLVWLKWKDAKLEESWCRHFDEFLRVGALASNGVQMLISGRAVGGRHETILTDNVTPAKYHDAFAATGGGYSDTDAWPDSFMRCGLLNTGREPHWSLNASPLLSGNALHRRLHQPSKDNTAEETASFPTALMVTGPLLSAIVD